MKDYKEKEVLNFLRKKGFSLNQKEKILTIQRKNIIPNKIGNNTWGRCDFLKSQGYNIVIDESELW